MSPQSHAKSELQLRQFKIHLEAYNVMTQLNLSSNMHRQSSSNAPTESNSSSASLPSNASSVRQLVFSDMYTYLQACTKLQREPNINDHYITKADHMLWIINL